MDSLQMLWQNQHVTGFRRLFYIVSPNETSFETVEEVPSYSEEAAPYFLMCIVVENLILLAQGKNTIRLNDGLNSVAHGIISTFHNLLFRSMEVATYMWIHQRFCLYNLPWDSPWVWLLCLVGTDFGYYWFHRAGHEVNIMWAGHQTHHGSEDYNLSTALRQSAVHRYVGWVFYLPLALFIPPAMFCVHTQFNLLYQFWIHTELVDKLGPLEYVLNTPSHHRVHHGRNRYCIDKNYAGVFIIWDRMFGTFEAEKENDKVVYGLVHPLQTWDPIYGQLCQLQHIIKTVFRLDGVGNKLSAIFKGPGWEPGKPRLGLTEELPDVKYPEKKYDSSLPAWGSVYIWVHFLLLIAANSLMGLHKESVGPLRIVVYILFALFSLTSFGALFDNKPYAPVMECLRCVVCFSVAQLYYPVTAQISWLSALHVFYLLSLLLWGCFTLGKFKVLKFKVQ